MRLIMICPLHLAASSLVTEAVPSVWREPWNWESAIVLPLALLLIVYMAGMARRGSILALRWRHASFFPGWLSLFFALTSPIHELGEQLFSAHMLQHEILILISAR